MLLSLHSSYYLIIYPHPATFILFSFYISSFTMFVRSKVIYRPLLVRSTIYIGINFIIFYSILFGILYIIIAPSSHEQK